MLDVAVTLVYLVRTGTVTLLYLSRTGTMSFKQAWRTLRYKARSSLLRLGWRLLDIAMIRIAQTNTRCNSFYVLRRCLGVATY